MFRNPREFASAARESVLPSTGRPPTPPTQSKSEPMNPSPYFSMPVAVSGAKSRPPQSSSPRVPVLGRQPAQRSASTRKAGAKQNKSILNFFGKAPANENSVAAPTTDTGLFFGNSALRRKRHNVERYSPLEGDEVSLHGILDDADRFNELKTPSKKRKVEPDVDLDLNLDLDLFVDGELSEQVTNHEELEVEGISSRTSLNAPKALRQRGGFIDDDSDEDDEVGETVLGREVEVDQNLYSQAALGDLLLSVDPAERISNDFRTDVFEAPTTTQLPVRPRETEISTIDGTADDVENPHLVPTLHREGTSMFVPQDFDPNDEFGDEEFPEEGEEYLERRWMEEQRDMEIEFDEDSKSESGGESVLTPGNEVESDESTPCPICNGSMAGLSEEQASSHVNACLDGTAAPLPKLAKQQQVSIKEEADGKPSSIAINPPQLAHLGSARFKRASIARPAQTNPFNLTPDAKSSAFSRLMSSHAEDAAWAAAASHEAASRGKPAYERTCPFYKIMPGLAICVDAFRYGKVAGQTAYFLSHFHSDHYIGLTSSWSHGPIYASKVTCNLIRQQLRVDAQWLVPLEFEKKAEVPNTPGVTVTMIPANHCPGSSLFLFEKVVGKNKDGSPKLTRILHCGDFRACPAHVNHPLLRPEVVDSISGKTKTQTIDTCYLDTTYLTPKYAFPSQADVITACAQMCVSLANEIPDVNDDWEQARSRTASTMTKFLESNKQDSPADSPVTDQKPKMRGRLLVVIGTYSIGKERICLGIAKALGSKIYAPPSKMRICACLEDPELTSLLTPDPLQAQVHMQTLMEIRAETLHEYLTSYHPHFSRVVGFRPTGWSYRPPSGRLTENPAVSTVLYSPTWQSKFSIHNLVPQRGSTKQSACYGVPYSEHSSFRELTMFCCALDIRRVVPTVNVGSARNREKMRGWVERWEGERRKKGFFKVCEEGEDTGEGRGVWGGDSMLRYGV